MRSSGRPFCVENTWNYIEKVQRNTYNIHKVLED